MAQIFGSEVAVTLPVATPWASDVNTKTRVPMGAFAREQVGQRDTSEYLRSPLPALLITRIVSCARQVPARVAAKFAPAGELGPVAGMVPVPVPDGVGVVEDGELSVEPLEVEVPIVVGVLELLVVTGLGLAVAIGEFLVTTTGWDEVELQPETIASAINDNSVAVRRVVLMAPSFRIPIA